MLIKQIYNNNVVLVVDESDGNEYILTGKGIGFGAKKDMHADETKIEKKFIPADEGMKRRVMELSKEVEAKVFEVVTEGLKVVEKSLGKKLHEYIYLALVDHISFSLKRAREGVFVRNTLLHEIKKIYKSEFMLAKGVVDLINMRFDVDLGDDEAGFITMHIVNSIYDSEFEGYEDINLLNIVKDILQIIRLFFRIDFDEDSIEYDRLITHLRFFAKRVVTKEGYSDSNEDLLDYIKLKCPKSYECMMKISDYLEKTYGYNVSKDEELYLTLHIDRVTKRHS